MHPPDGLSLLLDVTRDDLDNGLRGKSDTCPIALAVGRALRAQGFEVLAVEVGSQYGIKVEVARPDWEAGTYVCDDHSDQIWNFTQRYDTEDHVSPFTRKVLLSYEPPEPPDEYYEAPDVDDPFTWGPA